MAEHECTARPREPVRLIPPNAPEPLAHGDPRRYTSTTQRCRCDRCTAAYLDSKLPYRGADFRVAPRRRPR